MSIHVTKEAIYTSPFDVTTAENELEEHNYPWEIAPLWVKHAATDASGYACWFESKPEKGSGRFGYGAFPMPSAMPIENYTGNGADWENSLREMPVHEAEINRLADGALTVSESYQRIIKKKPIFPEAIEERRRIRIEAGLIESDTKESESVEDDLTWLARNVIEWHEEGDGRLVMIGALNSPRFPINCRGQEGFTQSQWLQRRIELGLATNPAEQPVSTDKEWDGEGWPPEKYLCEMDATKSDNWSAGRVMFYSDKDNLVWRDESTGNEFLATIESFRFRPIQDSEAKQREEWLKSCNDAMRKKGFSVSDHDEEAIPIEIQEAIYDWLIDTNRLVKDDE